MSPLPFHMKRVAEVAPSVDSTRSTLVAPDLVVVDLPSPARIAAAVMGAIELNLREEEPMRLHLALSGAGFS